MKECVKYTTNLLSCAVYVDFFNEKKLQEKLTY